jgi:hypothetical protein
MIKIFKEKGLDIQYFHSSTKTIYNKDFKKCPVFPMTRLEIYARDLNETNWYLITVVYCTYQSTIFLVGA